MVKDWIGFFTNQRPVGQRSIALFLPVLAGKPQAPFYCFGLHMDGFRNMKSRWLYLQNYLLLIVLSSTILLPVLTHASQFYSDFGHHVDVALALPTTVRHIAHVLFHALFLLVHKLLPPIVQPHAEIVVTTLLFMLPVPLISFSAFKRAANQMLPDAMLMTLSLCLMVLAPVTVWSNRYMLGYFNPILYHNPTMMALRMFALPVSLLAVGVFQARSSSNLNYRTYQVMLCAVLVVLTTLTKPSYTLALIPGCCLFAILRLLMRRKVNFPLLVFGICLPGIIMLGMLYLLVYFSYDDATTVAFGILTFMKSLGPAWRILIQFALSLVFPIGVYLSYRTEARQDLYLNLSWMIFWIGAAFAYLFYEVGPRFGHANFLWSGHSAVFVLMFASILFFCRMYSSRIQRKSTGKFKFLGLSLTRREAFVLLLLGLHVISGIAYYFRFLGTAPLRVW